MPNCFAMTRIGESEYVGLAEVDNAARKHFGAPEDAEHWYLDWYNWMGLMFACGESFDGIRKNIRKHSEKDATESAAAVAEMALIDYLEKNYTVESWYQHK